MDKLNKARAEYRTKCIDDACDIAHRARSEWGWPIVRWPDEGRREGSFILHAVPNLNLTPQGLAKLACAMVQRAQDHSLSTRSTAE